MGNLACRLAMGVGAGNSTTTHAREVGQLLHSDVFKKCLVRNATTLESFMMAPFPQVVLWETECINLQPLLAALPNH